MTTSLFDPLIANTRKPTEEEHEKLLAALQHLLTFAREERNYTGEIQAPDQWRVMDKVSLGFGYALGSYGILYGTAFDSSYLPAVCAHIIGWYNRPNEKQPAHHMVTARDRAASFSYERLPSFTDDMDDYESEVRPVYRQALTPLGWDFEEVEEPHTVKTHRHINVKPSGLPEELRPKPIDVVLGGGHNYSSFGYRQSDSFSGVYSEQTEDSARGLIAVTEYLDALRYGEDKEARYKVHQMKKYFKEREEYADFFKKAQKYADGYAVLVFGQGAQLMELLSRHQNLSSTDGQQTLHFYQPLKVRIDYLKKLI